jgi:hypothetical protein
MLAQQTKEISEEVKQIDELLTQSYNKGELAIFIEDVSVVVIQYLKMHGYDVDEIVYDDSKGFLISW